MSTLYAVIASAIISAAGSAWVTATYYRAEAAENAVEQFKQGFAQVSQKITEFNGEVQELNKAERKARDELFAAQTQFSKTMQLLGGVRTDIGQLRGQYATLDQRLAAAAPDDAKRYAQTCHKLLTAMGAEGTEMAAAGAELARDADGHSIDAERQEARAHIVNK